MLSGSAARSGMTLNYGLGIFIPHTVVAREMFGSFSTGGCAHAIIVIGEI